MFSYVMSYELCDDFIYAVNFPVSNAACHLAFLGCKTKCVFH